MRSTVLCLADATRDRNAKWGTVLSVGGTVSLAVMKMRRGADRLQAPPFTPDGRTDSGILGTMYVSSCFAGQPRLYITATCRVSPSTNNI
jgi:hypothetical protein